MRAAVPPLQGMTQALKPPWSAGPLKGHDTSSKIGSANGSVPLKAGLQPLSCFSQLVQFNTRPPFLSRYGQRAQHSARGGNGSVRIAMQGHSRMREGGGEGKRVFMRI